MHSQYGCAELCVAAQLETRRGWRRNTFLVAGVDTSPEEYSNLTSSLKAVISSCCRVKAGPVWTGSDTKEETFVSRLICSQHLCFSFFQCRLVQVAVLNKSLCPMWCNSVCVYLLCCRSEAQRAVYIVQYPVSGRRLQVAGCRLQVSLCSVHAFQ